LGSISGGLGATSKTGQSRQPHRVWAALASGASAIGPRARDFNVALDACNKRAADAAADRPFAARQAPSSDGRGVGAARCSVLTADGAQIVAQVRGLLAAMETASFVPDDFAYSAAIVACGRAGDPDAALALFAEMEARAAAVVAGVTNAALATTSTAAAGTAATADDNDKNNNDDDQNDDSVDNNGESLAMSSLGEGLNPPTAAAREDNAKPTSVVAFARSKKKKPWEPRPPNSHCYRAALSVCQAYARAPEAKRLLRQLARTGAATAVDYSYALQTCERAGDWRGAFEVVTEMQSLAATAGPGHSGQATRHNGQNDDDDDDDRYRSEEAGDDEADYAEEDGSPPGEGAQARGSSGSSSSSIGVRARALELLATLPDDRDVDPLRDDENAFGVTGGLPTDRGAYEKERSRAVNAAVVVCAGAGQWEAARSLIATIEKRHGAGAVDQVLLSIAHVLLYKAHCWA
jgi:pentatricopeptide repeat protein